MKIIKEIHLADRGDGFFRLERYFPYSEELWQEILDSVSKDYSYQIRSKEFFSYTDNLFLTKTTYSVIELEEEL